MRRVAVAVAAVAALAGGAALALHRFSVHDLADALAAVRPGWLAVGAALMAASLVLRAASWLVVLRAALPGRPVPAASVLRGTMIGVMASAALPGRVGEAARAVVVARRLGPVRANVSVVAGTILAQTVLNLAALAILASVVLSSTPLLDAPAGLASLVALPLVLILLLVGGPALLRRFGGLARQLQLARAGLRVFRSPATAVAAAVPQLAAWALQVAACDAVLHALRLRPDHGYWVAAAAVLLAVNVTAVVPVSPSNVGIFQGACIAVLGAYGIAADHALAYGIVLQVLEVATAFAVGLPALAAEGLTWEQVRGSEALGSGGPPARGRRRASPV